MKKSNKDKMLALGLSGFILSACGDLYTATKDLPPPTAGSNLKLVRNDRIQIIVYSIVDALSGGLIGTVPFLIKWHIDNKEP
jgi:hypothetical protein